MTISQKEVIEVINSLAESTYNLKDDEAGQFFTVEEEEELVKASVMFFQEMGDMIHQMGMEDPFGTMVALYTQALSAGILIGRREAASAFEDLS